MDQGSKISQRKDRLSNIRLSLQNLPIIKQTSVQLGIKLQKNRSRKASAAFTDKQMTLSKVYSDSDLDDQDKFHSVFKDKFTLGDKIGQGAHGVVKKCYDKSTNDLYAVKTITLDRQHILFLKRNFIDIKSLKHRHIIGYKAIFFQMKTETCHLVMDYLPYPNLLQIDCKSQEILREIVYQVLHTLVYIHEKKICHRDIKPQNILYDKQERCIKIIDFGISKKLIERGRKKDMLTLTGTPYYRAPEMFEGGGYDQIVDLWALGVTIYKLMTGITPFESQYHSETISNIIKGQFSFPPQAEARYSKLCRNLVVRLLKKRCERLTANEAIKDMWLIDMYKNEDELTKSLSLNQNFLFNNISVDMYNNSLVGSNNIQTRKKDSLKKPQQLNLKQGKSFKQILQIEQEQSMIYGCQQFAKKPYSTKQSYQTKQI